MTSRALALLHQPRLERANLRLAAWVSVWAGSALVAGSGILHFFLWRNYGYRNIHVIGPLFLMQAAVGVALAVVASVTRHWLAALGELVFALASAGGLLFSIYVGLFGWQEASNGPWVWQALAIEFGAAAALIPALVLLGRAWLAGRPRQRTNADRSLPHLIS
jgi:hypothetical protein